MLNLAGRAAFVTGGGSGIGRAIGLALAARGAYLWIADFDEAGAGETVRLIEAAGGRALALRHDVRDEAQWETALAATDAHDEKLRILVNCAGKSVVAETFAMPLATFKDIMAVNVEGNFLGMKHAVPRIAAAGGGAVVNISSIAGIMAAPRAAAYCAAKGAIRMMTKAVALECAALGNNVRVNSVHPGIVDTPAWSKHGADETNLIDDAIGGGAVVLNAHDVARKMVPLGVACSAEEVAQTVAFLVSDEARHITAAEIVIDGGMTAA